MAASEISVKDSAASTNVAVEVIDAGTAPPAVTSGHAARQVVALGDGGGAGQYAGVDSANRLQVAQPERIFTAVALTMSGVGVAAGPWNSAGCSQATFTAASPSATGTAGVIAIQGSINGTDWVQLNCASSSNSGGYDLNNNSSIALNNPTVPTTNGGIYVWRASTTGFQQVRLYCSGTGTKTDVTLAAAFTVNQSQPPNPAQVQIYGNGGSLSTVGGAGTATIGGIDGFKATYSASYVGLAGVAGDVVVLGGSASKAIRLRRVLVSGTATSSTTIDMQIIKRTTADTSGTAVTAATIVSHDSFDSAASATLTAYSAAPTTGTSAGIVRVWKEQLLAVANFNDPYELHFVDQFDKAPILRGTTQQYCLNMSSAPAGTSMNVTFVWTEE